MPTALVGAALLAALLGGCAGAPPTDDESTPLFASEEEAYAAAEETYLAYADAVARVKFSDSATFENALSYSLGDYQQDERKFLVEMKSSGYERSGSAEILWIHPQQFDDATGSVTIRVCEDVSPTTFTDAQGNSLVSAEREDVVATDVQMTESSGVLRIVSSTPVRDDECVR